MASGLYRYYADVFASFDFGSYRDSKFFVGGGVLTWILEDGGANFQPDRYRGTIELGAYQPRGSSTLTAYIKHQSFHVIDRENPAPGTESYEIYALGYGWRGRPNFFISIGKYANIRHVDYEWEFLLTADTSCPDICNDRRFYGAFDLHYVLIDKALFDKDDFLDYSIEAGYQLVSGLKYFLAYRQIHDLDRVGGTIDRHWVAGVKYRW